jgi:hypothetical protein
VLTVCLFAVAVQAQYSGGSGTAGDPYQIGAAWIDDIMLRSQQESRIGK